VTSKTSRSVIFLAAIGLVAAVLYPSSNAQDSRFREAPASTDATNPVAGQADAIRGGLEAYADHCAGCHGFDRKGSGNIPALDQLSSVNDGELFWFISNGDVNDGMPAWNRLPEQQRWQIVTFLKSGGGDASAAATPAPAPSPPARPRRGEGSAVNPATAPPPPAPFVDFRSEQPGFTHKISVQDIPKPFASESSANFPRLVPRPADAWPKAPAGFKVELYAADLKGPRLIHTAPNGDYFVAESDPGDIQVFRGITADGKAKQSEIFASGLNRPYGIAFYPPGPNPEWIYIGDTDAILRFPYHNGDRKASGPSQHLVDVPKNGNHWTRAVAFSRDGMKMYVGVGSASNVDDPDTTPAERGRATIMEYNPDGTGGRVYASGIRNPGVGVEVSPLTGEVWCSVNERDALGDNLVPDYITHVQKGGFYGWPWWYMGGHQDPRLAGKHPELKDKVITPDVLLQPHNASLDFDFYEGSQFPAQYKGDIFASEHGSWNKSIRAGYELILVPLDKSGHATGQYQDFVTGFVTAEGNAWGRPVGVTMATDGSLLVTDDGSDSIWRVSYTGK
jgi:glucose/arabinose dehydrogenase/mono/diheme cytochrome c family protein